MSYDSTCNNCPYHKQQNLIENQKTARTCPPIELETNNSNILLVLQAPGYDEWKVGKAIQPTVKKGGSAGRRVELSWERSNKKRSDFDIINSVQCYPGRKNGKRDFTPDFMAIRSCSKRLETILETSKYEKVVVFGEIAKQVITEICKKFQLSLKIIPAKHPNNGASSDDLDNSWKDC